MIAAGSFCRAANRPLDGNALPLSHQAVSQRQEWLETPFATGELLELAVGEWAHHQESASALIARLAGQRTAKAGVECQIRQPVVDGRHYAKKDKTRRKTRKRTKGFEGWELKD